jgi:hypothetical protein
MAISPNNGSFLLNMSKPLVTFSLVVSSKNLGKNAVCVVNFVNNNAIS